MTLTTREILRRIRRLEIRTRRLVNESLAGEYHSMFKGRGMEFSEVREYEQGDDIRTIDWNVTARMGSPYVKKYVEERELTVQILYDASASGMFGSFGSRKKEMAAEIACILAFSAIKNNDKVGLINFTNSVETYIPPKKGRDHVLRIIREILFFQPEGKATDINNALTFLGRISTKRSVVFLISDFFDSDYEQNLNILNRKHDIVSIAIRDGAEITFPDVGLMSTRDLETGEEMMVDTSHSGVRKHYRRKMDLMLESTRNLMKKAGVDFLELLADQPYEKTLTSFFSARARGIRM